MTDVNINVNNSSGFMATVIGIVGGNILKVLKEKNIITPEEVDAITEKITDQIQAAVSDARSKKENKPD